MPFFADLKMRTLINAFAACIAIGGVLISTVPYWNILFILLTALIASVALWEYYQLAEKKGVICASKLGVLWTVLFIFATFAELLGSLALEPKTVGYLLITHLPEMVLAVAFFSFFVLFANPRKEPIVHIATSFFGLIYIALPFALMVRIAYVHTALPYKTDATHMGIFWLFYLFAVTKGADLGGYFFGKLLGRRRFALRLSPNKTAEGAIAGLLSSLATSLLFGLIAHHLSLYTPPLSWWLFGLFGLLIGVASELGDLAESLLKRDAKVKDSSRLPGIGGILDLVDSLLFTTPLLYLLLKVFII